MKSPKVCPNPFGVLMSWLMLTTENQKPVRFCPFTPPAAASRSTYSCIAPSFALAAICQAVSHSASPPPGGGGVVVVVEVEVVVEGGAATVVVVGATVVLVVAGTALVVVLAGGTVLVGDAVVGVDVAGASARALSAGSSATSFRRRLSRSSDSKSRSSEGSGVGGRAAGGSAVGATVVVVGRRSEPPEMSRDPEKKALPAVSSVRGSANASRNQPRRRPIRSPLRDSNVLPPGRKLGASSSTCRHPHWSTGGETGREANHRDQPRRQLGSLCEREDPGTIP